jgi:hypothetical protein
MWIEIWVCLKQNPQQEEEEEEKGATSTTSPSGRQLGVLHTYMWGEEERLIELWGVL